MSKYAVGRKKNPYGLFKDHISLTNMAHKIITSLWGRLAIAKKHGKEQEFRKSPSFRKHFRLYKAYLSEADRMRKSVRMISVKQ